MLMRDADDLESMYNEMQLYLVNQVTSLRCNCVSLVIMNVIQFMVIAILTGIVYALLRR